MVISFLKEKKKVPSPKEGCRPTFAAVQPSWNVWELRDTRSSWTDYVWLISIHVTLQIRPVSQGFAQWYSTRKDIS